MENHSDGELATEDTNLTDSDPLAKLDHISNTNDSQKVTLTNETENKIPGNEHRKYTGRKLKTDECAICQKKFNIRADFIKHAQIEHPNAKAFKCKDCSMVFTNIHSVSRHRKIHEDMPKKHVCEFCPKSFLNKDTLKRHVAIHYKDHKRSYSCYICGKIYMNKLYLEKHEKTHIKQVTNNGDKDINLICTNKQMYLTDKDAEENTALKEELNTNYDSKIENIMNLSNDEESNEFKADPLKDNFNTSKSQQVDVLKNNCINIRRHKPMLDVDKNCAICHKEFNFHQDLVKHVKIYHPKAKAYKCNKCSMRFANIYSISRHSRIHKNQHKEFLCSYCPKSFMHKYALSRHLARHNRKSGHKKKPAIDRKCAVCHEEFDMLQDLIEHAKKFHPDCKRFKCGICPKVFKNIHCVSRHRRIHKNLPLAKRHVCEICSKAFSFKESLKRHLITHSRSTRYSCSLCLKSYKNKISLENHKKSNDCQMLNVKRSRKPMVKDKHTVERKCAVCQEEFNYRQELVKHAKENHPNEKAFKCTICSMVFVNIISIARHRRIHKNLPIPKRNVCEVCSKSFSFKESLKRHLKMHLRTSYTCSLCLKSYKHKISLENHKKSNDCQMLNVKRSRNPMVKDKHTVERKCAVCQKEFNYRHELVKHAKENHPNEKAFKCTICSMVFVNIISIARHRRIHKNLPIPKRHVCEICSKSFSFKESLKRHLKMHTKRTQVTKKVKKNNSCASKSTFHKTDNKRQLKVHTKNRSNQPAVERKCAVCNEEFNYRHELVKHAKENHPNDKAFKCTICSMVFVNIISIARHRRIHKNLPIPKRHVCEICSKSFSFKESLKRHLKMHLKRTSYTCSLCLKSYKHKISLENHKKSNDCQMLNVKRSRNPMVKDKHTVERKCAVCQKEFNYRHELVKHAKENHPNEKAFKCTICSMVFVNIISIARHRRIHKNLPIPKRHVCEICSKSFSFKESLKRHLKMHTRRTQVTKKVKKNNSCASKSTFHKTENKRHHNTTSQPAVERKCAVCHEEFHSRQDLMDHAQQNHPNAKAFKCGVCSMVFTNVHYISRHRRIHKDMPIKYSCEICSTSLRDKDSYNRHLKTLKHKTKIKSKSATLEDGERTEIPTFSINSPKDLPKQYLCELCEKSFIYHSQLRRHLSKHSWERPYTCTLCKKSYKRIEDVKTHQRKFHHLNQYLVKRKSKLKTNNEKVKQDNLIRNENILNLNNNNDNSQLNVLETSNIDCGESISFQINHDFVGDEETTNSIEVNDFLGFKECNEENMSFLNDFGYNEEQFSNSSLEVQGVNCPETRTSRFEKNIEDLMSIITSDNYDINAVIDKDENTLDTKNTSGINKDNLSNSQSEENNCTKDDSLTLTDSQKKQKILKNNTDSTRSLKSNQELIEEKKCDLCKKKFFSHKDFVRHVENCQAFKCLYCDDRFSSFKSLSFHMTRVHEDLKNKYNCKFCSKSFHTERNFKVHLRIHTGERPNPCKTNIHLDNKDSCENCPTDEMKTLENRQVIKEECSSDSESIVNLEATNIIEIAKTEDSCKNIHLDSKDSCENSPTDKMKALENTQVIKEEYSSDSESIVNLEATNIIEIAKTEESCKNIHLDNKDSCENSPTNEMKTLVNTQVIKEECSSDTESIVNLEATNIIEIAKTEYQEDNELSDFIKTGPHLNDDLLVEMPTKQKYKPKTQKPLLYDNICGVCDKKFDSQYQLVKHAKQFHPKGKVLRCLVCNSLHSSVSQLRTHLDKIHGNSIYSVNECSIWKKPFNCEFCDKSFIRKSQLQIHLRSHTVELPYSCSSCQKRFRQRINLLDHEESVHPNIKSTVCDEESNDVNFLMDVISKRSFLQ